eukprot:scaffold197747_cov19-Tisochrysis_lutea.AAC.1
MEYTCSCESTQGAAKRKRMMTVWMKCRCSAAVSIRILVQLADAAQVNNASTAKHSIPQLRAQGQCSLIGAMLCSMHAKVWCAAQIQMESRSNMAAERRALA